MKSKGKIVITGGHHNSALVVAQELIKKGYEIIWLGHRYAARGDQNDSAEYLEVSESGIPFFHLSAGKLTLDGGFSNILKIPLGVFRAFHFLSKLKPDAVISFGGYLGLPVALSAWLKGIPVYLHEQTVVAGLANRLTASFAKKIFLTWESSLAFFPREKTQVVGLPVRKTILESPGTPLFKNSLPTLLVMGGKQGSHRINAQIFRHLTELLTGYNLLHQTGNSTVTKDYQKALSLKASLPQELADRYSVKSYLNEMEIGEALRGADYYLGRSGAHITYELALVGTRALLIPLLASRGQEQLKNAETLKEWGQALILNQAELSYEKIVSSLSSLSMLTPHPSRLPVDAGARIASLVSNDLR